ncbi:MAG: cysteine--tRNA ligase [Candidatus Babeliaceae bacterium]
MVHIRLTDTLTGNLQPLIPQEKNKVTLYVCGITPYDFAHVGHGRVYVTFDVLYRLLKSHNYEVLYCRNFTDIDDKLILRAEKEYQDPFKYAVVADTFITAFNEDMHALQCLKPTFEPRVTENMDAIIQFVQGLVTQGHAYVVDGDVYFRISSFPEYGKLSKRKRKDLLAGARVAVNERKEDPLDFVLWKAEAPNSYWKSPWGYGRPGWHIECSTLADIFLGQTIDIHGGGMDLIFPHHENEIAQSESLHGKQFVRLWVHNAFVQINKEKMSKSLQNFFTLRDLFKKHDPMVIRYMILMHQYRNPLDFSLGELAGIEKTYQRLCKLFVATQIVADYQKSPLVQQMLAHLTDDLNTPALLGVLFENIKIVQENEQERAAVKTLLQEILGLSLQPLPEKTIEITPKIEELIQLREQARKNKDWQQADKLRDELKTLGYEVHDQKLN